MSGETATQCTAARILASHLNGARFRAGEDAGRWGLPDGASRDEFPKWPKVILWVKARPRKDAPERFFFSFDFTNYPTDAQTGQLIDPASGALLPEAKRPKGSDRVLMVFRTNWKDGTALYHPYDRVAIEGHNEWPRTHPHLIWTPKHTVCDLLVELHGLLDSEEYTHV